MYHVGRCTHIYPFCWRCDTPLLYYGKPTWFIRTSQLKDRLLANNQLINWYPSHIREGRFGNWLENNVDWALGRDRYWGTPLPVWVCDRCQKEECFGSVESLRERSRQSKRVGLGRSSFDLPELDLHRPYIDEITVNCECGGVMHRTPEVIDCWFDSGAMQVAQWHYPFENEELFQDQYPADFISEGIDQTRGWFYSLHAIATLLFDQPCFRNCICFGHVLDADGQKMSKSKGNVVDPWDVVKAHGADAMRWSFYTASPPDYPRRFSVDLVADSVRKFALTLWNVYSFFVTYANIDGFDPRSEAPPVGERPPLDRWILSELHQLVGKVDDDLAHYEMTRPARAIQEFVQDLSNWYVRRSRRRFWKSEADQDKAAAHHTLYECLVTLCKLIAPFQPFTAEEMYQNLVRSPNPRALESVHFCNYPQAYPELIDEALMAEMRAVMRVVALGHAARNQAGIKVRQPLAYAVVKPHDKAERDGLERLSTQIRDELNVYEVVVTDEESDLVSYRLRAVPSRVGKKFKSLLPAIQGALEDLSDQDRWAAVTKLRAGEPIQLTVQVLDVTLDPEDVEILAVPWDHTALAKDARYMVALSTQIDELLQVEGLAREVVRRIQTMRKEAGFRIEDTITTWYQAPETMESVFTTWGKYIRQETLSRQLLGRTPPQDAFVQTFQLEGQSVTLGVRRPRRR